MECQVRKTKKKKKVQYSLNTRKKGNMLSMHFARTNEVVDLKHTSNRYFDTGRICTDIYISFSSPHFDGNIFMYEFMRGNGCFFLHLLYHMLTCNIFLYLMWLLCWLIAQELPTVPWRISCNMHHFRSNIILRVELYLQRKKIISVHYIAGDQNGRRSIGVWIMSKTLCLRNFVKVGTAAMMPRAPRPKFSAEYETALTRRAKVSSVRIPNVVIHIPNT